MRESVQVIDAETARTRQQAWTGGDKGGGFWSWLFGDVEEERGRGLPQAHGTYYDQELESGAALLVVTAPDEQSARVAQLMERRGGDVESESDAAPKMPSRAASADVPAGSSMMETEQVLPEVEEQVRIGKRAVDQGTVRVYTHVTERPVEEHIKLREERVKLERRPVDRPVDAPARAFEEQTIELTETVEEPVVEKTARVVGEVVVSTDVRERDDTVRETVRQTRVETDRGSAAGGSATSRGDFAAMENDFRQHCSTRSASSGLSYEQASPAYRYGYELAGRGGDDWAAVERDARGRWEQERPGTWERFKDAIRYAWERARGTARAA